MSTALSQSGGGTLAACNVYCTHTPLASCPQPYPLPTTNHPGPTAGAAPIRVCWNRKPPSVPARVLLKGGGSKGGGGGPRGRGVRPTPTPCGDTWLCQVMIAIREIAQPPPPPQEMLSC